MQSLASLSTTTESIAAPHLTGDNTRQKPRLDDGGETSSAVRVERLHSMIAIFRNQRVGKDEYTMNMYSCMNPARSTMKRLLAVDIEHSDPDRGRSSKTRRTRRPCSKPSMGQEVARNISNTQSCNYPEATEVASYILPWRSLHITHRTK